MINLRTFLFVWVLCMLVLTVAGCDAKFQSAEQQAKVWECSVSATRRSTGGEFNDCVGGWVNQ